LRIAAIAALNCVPSIALAVVERDFSLNAAAKLPPSDQSLRISGNVVSLPGCGAGAVLHEAEFIRHMTIMPDATDEVPISHLQRRKIEGRVLIPFIEACREKFGDAATHELVVATIRRLAIEDGDRWGQAHGRGLAALKDVVQKVWGGSGSLDIEIIATSEGRLDFNVNRCRYAEFYKELGLADLGYLIHCNRDHAMIDGFNPDLKLTRTRTVMEGASHCDFRFAKKP
jgi:L-2-amino-thiazoline-4-carboxylic acid hydrolase